MLKTSLFNKGIYKSGLSRFKWGSLMYFVLLFFSTSFILLVNNYENLSTYAIERYINSGGLILHNDFMIFPTLIASFVPTVVACLTFDMFSSKRHSVFIHSLPSKRSAIYISSIFSAFTLFAIPVVLNGIILIALSAFKFAELFTIYACIQWMIANLILLFIMFSVSVFSASITSSRVGLVFTNAILHFLPLIMAFCISGIASCYLYGFNDNSGIFIKSTLEWMPAFSHWFIGDYGISGYLCSNILSLRTLIFVSGAVILYIASFLLYRKRNIESAGNIVAFKVLNPILKYTICTIGTLFTFSILQYGNFERSIYMVFLLVSVSLILYFGSEMVLKKNLKVFKSYKGYLIFATAIILLNTFIQYTSFFGYEVHIPDVSEVKEVAISNYYNSNFTDDEDVIAEAIKAHESIIKTPPSSIKQNVPDYYHMNISYTLKNGKRIYRSYPDLSLSERDDIMTKLYTHKAYRLASDDLHKIDTKFLDYMRINFSPSPDYSYSFNIEGKEKLREFLSVWKKDIEVLGYKEKILESDGIFSIIPMYTEDFYSLSDTQTQSMFHGTSFFAGYKNTINFLRENGYLEDIFKTTNYNCYISKTSYKIETGKEGYVTRQYYADKKEVSAYTLSFDDVVSVKDNDVYKLLDAVLSGELKDTDEDGEYFIVYLMRRDNNVLESYTKFLSIPKDTLPEYLIKYTK